MPDTTAMIAASPLIIMFLVSMIAAWRTPGRRMWSGGAE